jgi:hypothetical protein
MSACQIRTFFHCRKCLLEKPADVSPAEWSRTQTGYTADGSIQVWCNRHDEEIVTFRTSPR